MIAVVVALALISPSSSLSAAARKEMEARDKADMEQGITAKQVDAVFQEMERRCLQGDVDGATEASLLWWKPTGMKMNTEQFQRLLDVCLAQNGMLGEIGNAPKGSKCALPSESQCEWAQKCVTAKDCSKPPLGEIMMQIKASKEEPAQKQKPALVQQGEKGIDDINLPTPETVKNELEKAANAPKVVFTPGTWVARCPACNLALNMAWWAENDGPVLKDLPVYNELDTILWDVIVPFVVRNPYHGVEKDPVKVAAKMDKELNNAIDVSNGLKPPKWAKNGVVAEAQKVMKNTGVTAV